MANSHTTLSNLFSDTADAIREVGGSSATIIADNFPDAIRSLPVVRIPSTITAGDTPVAMTIGEAEVEGTNSSVTIDVHQIAIQRSGKYKVYILGHFMDTGSEEYEATIIVNSYNSSGMFSPHQISVYGDTHMHNFIGECTATCGAGTNITVDVSALLGTTVIISAIIVSIDWSNTIAAPTSSITA